MRAGSYFRKTPFFDKEVNFWTLNIILRHHHPPMEIIAHIPVLAFFGVTEFVARIPYLFSGVISVVIFYKIAKELYGTIAAHLAATFAAVNGYFIAFSRHVQFEGLFLLFSLLTVYYSVKFYKSNALKDSGLAAFFFDLTLLSHHFGIFMVIPLLYVIFQKRYEKSLETKNLVVTIIYYNLVAVVSYDGQPTMFIFGPSPLSEITELNTEKYEKLFDEEFGSIENSLYKYFGGSYPTTMV